jgi:hypothetical protein
MPNDVDFLVMARKIKRKPGRPAHHDDPPKLFSTTIPTSAYELLSRISDAQNRPKSEVLADALRAYGRRMSYN